MITSIPLLFSVLWVPVLSWINSSSTFILFGLYYGFLATLPIGPSQLLSVRSFLLEGNIGGAVAISGSITGQLIIFLSIYYSPLYVILVKPHILTLLVLPYIFFYWYRIKDLSNYQSLKPVASLRDTRIYKLFFDSMIFQLLNPVLLPSPVLARLLNLFTFRYSNNILFVTSTLLGWFGGQYLFIHLSRSLLFRIESDSPILYLLLKRTIHRTFSITILSLSLLHLGRTPVPFITKKIIDNLQFNSPKREESQFPQKSWLNLFLDYRRWNRPLRYIGNSRFSTRSPAKEKVSQYFFDVCLSDGKQRLSFAYLPSLAIFEKNLENYFNPLKFWTSGEFFMEWINTRRGRKKNIYDEFRHRIEFLDNGFAPGEVTEKKTGSLNFEGEIFTKIYDPLLTGQNRKVMVMSKSPWLLTEKYNKSSKKRKSQIFPRRGNKLKFWISNQWKELDYKTFTLPWEPLTRDARRTLSLLINKSKKIGIGTNLKQIHFSDGDAAAIDPNDKSTADTRKKVNRKSNINWELILNLSTRQKTLYFNYLQIDEWNTLRNSWRNLFRSDTTRVGDVSLFLAKILRVDKKFQFREMNREVPRWTSDLKNDRFDVIAIGVTDIRQRKVKNLGYLMRGRDKRRKIVRRFSQQSDFRRKLVKGSMRARRRKTLIWKMFQLGVNSPFFSRMNDRPIFIQTFSYGKKFHGSKPIFRNIFGDEESSNGKVSFLRRTRADRLAIANRWDFPLAQWGRSWLLIIQSHCRKYFVLPILIVLKNVIRSLLFQNPEWNEDWFEWNKEVHIRCTYDGTEVSEKELPEQWLRDGLQIKIIYPFRLKPWRDPKYRDRFFGKNEKSSNKSIESLGGGMKKGYFDYCYLTVWGFRTNLPFGNMKKQPPFWKPINRELKKRLRENTFYGFLALGKKNFVIPNTPGSGRLDIQIGKSTEFNSNSLYSSNKYQRHDARNNNEIRELSIAKNENLTPDRSKNFEYETIYIQNLEKFIDRRDPKEFEVYPDKDRKVSFCPTSRKNRPESENRLIRIKKIIMGFRRKGMELAQKLFHLLSVDIQKIETNLSVEIETIKELIRNLPSSN